MNVEEQKQEARALEQRGETEQALGLYAAILSEIEGTKEIWRELPLYVKAGDLSLKLGRTSDAISHYETAARKYASYGSSKSVIALCSKILRVNAAHTHAYLRLVRLMIEREHLEEARLVLIEYAERLKLTKAKAVLEGLTDCPEGQCKPVLEMLLELGGRYEYARAQGRDESPEAETLVGEWAGEGTPTAADPEDDVAEKAVGDDVGDGEASPPVVHQDGDAEWTAVIGEPQPGEETESGSESADAPDPATSITGERDAELVDDRPMLQMPIPRASRAVLFNDSARNKNRGANALWIALGAAAVVIVGGLALVLFNVIPIGESQPASRPVPRLAPPDSARTEGAELEDSTGAETDAANREAEGTRPNMTTPSAAPAPAGGVAGAAVLAADAVTNAGDSVGDDVGDSAAGASAEVATADSSPVLPPGRGVMVGDFEVESTTEFSENGRAGYRVTQRLGTGEILTLSAVFYGDEIASAPGSEQMTLTPLVGDTTTAVIQFSGYFVEARAIVSASVLETLLGRLAEIPVSN